MDGIQATGHGFLSHEVGLGETTHRPWSEEYDLDRKHMSRIHSCLSLVIMNMAANACLPYLRV